ncbi:MBL fold metallo-hydrolase [Caballeronia cordobensis]|uniref:hypothetical protein n=1 Tax=Caballeronia cordobensis TaxID=1353886 RepID=UPI00128E9651|nr:hypothetical protein [Caballeronia cordobensis]
MDDIALLPLGGQTFGYASIAVRKESGWLMLAADSYFFHAEMDVERPRCTPGLAIYQWMMDKDRVARRWNQARLRGLCAGDTWSERVDAFGSHDPIEFELGASRTGFRRHGGESARTVWLPTSAASASAGRRYCNCGGLHGLLLSLHPIFL